MFWVKKDSQKQMPKTDFSKKRENTYFKTHNRLFFDYFFNRRRIWEALAGTPSATCSHPPPPPPFPSNYLVL